jgi:hypothetical protein
MKASTTILFALLFSLTTLAQTANDFASYKPYTGAYGFGLNPGFYSMNWTTQAVCKLGYDLGAKNFRMLLYNNILDVNGYQCVVSDYEYITKTLGVKDLACMVGGVSDANRWNPFNQTTEWNGVTYDAGQMWKGMYEPIWLPDGSVNPANTYADYLYKTVTIYGKYIKFWEVTNEPDFTYGSGGWMGDVDPTNKDSWFWRDPVPEELTNIRATVPYYIRLLRISWEVIKKLSPDSYVCTGGIGNRSFLSSLLRNTDNPVDGSATPQYPLKAGAYFDVVSFHDYPEFSTLLRWWDNSVGIVYDRHSDKLVQGHLIIKKWMDSLLRLDGYDGTHKPIKQFICTETGASRSDDINQGFGGSTVQLNYAIKCQVKTLMDGQIKQMYWYATGDYNTQAHWDVFGLYYWFGDNAMPNATLADQGRAYKTLTSFLDGKVYDSSKTKTLNIPTTADGGAFKGADGKYVYVLWAKTTTDLSELATATINMEKCKRTEWNGTTQSASGSVQLTATPSFFEPDLTALPIRDKPAPLPHTPTPQWYHAEVYDYLGRKLKTAYINNQQAFEKTLPRGQHFIVKYFNTKTFTTKQIFNP